MTLLNSTKTNSNLAISENERLNIQLNSSSFTKEKEQKILKRGGLAQTLVFLSSIFNISTSFRSQSLYPIDLNQSVIFEERVKSRISFAEARKLSLNTFNNYQALWDSYLQEEGKILFNVDKF